MEDTGGSLWCCMVDVVICMGFVCEVECMGRGAGVCDRVEEVVGS